MCNNVCRTLQVLYCGDNKKNEAQHKTERYMQIMNAKHMHRHLKSYQFCAKTQKIRVFIVHFSLY